MRSLKEGRRDGAVLWRVGTSIFGTTGASIFGGGSGGGGGGLSSVPPGGMICADATFPAASTAATAQTRIDNRFIEEMS